MAAPQPAKKKVAHKTWQAGADILENSGQNHVVNEVVVFPGHSNERPVSLLDKGKAYG